MVIGLWIICFSFAVQKAHATNHLFGRFRGILLLASVGPHMGYCVHSRMSLWKKKRLIYP